ncbi:MAG TPA: MFS transporter [Terracidiphilus sp.]|jgi:ACS family tartrate transporter-like MFS transporter
MSPLYRKIAWRLVPFLMLLYMVAFLDRVNISFAALTMNRDLGISASVYGFAAGVFFLSYCLFEIPANMVLTRLGARRWLAILMVIWGFVSMGTAFVHTEATYIFARFLLGIAESGFYPGVIYYFTFWMPRNLRTRILALFLLAVPICNCIGSPISAHILLLDTSGGLKGWQWLFLLEGAPALVLGAAAWFLLSDGPWSATWLSQTEREQVRADLERDSALQVDSGSQTARIARDCVIYFLWSTGIYGLTFWLPKILTSVGSSDLATGWWGALTFGFGALAMLWASRQSGFRTLPFLMLAAAVGFIAAGLAHSVSLAVVGFCIAAMGILASLPMFWSLATRRLSGKAAGSAIALINSVGAVGAFAGPSAMGWLHDLTHHYSAGLWAIAGALVTSGLLVHRESSKAPHPVPQPAD